MRHRSFLAASLAGVALVVLTLAGRLAARADVPAQERGVCRVMPMLTPGRTAVVPARAHLDYFGGRVVSNVQIVQVLWGTGLYEPFIEPSRTSSMDAFFAAFANSSYLDALAQYATDRPGVNGTPGTNQHIGRGTFQRQVRIAPPRATLVSDADVIAELGRQIRAGGLPRPSADAAGNANTVYVVNFPAGKTITVGGGTSCATFCAYHGAFDLDGQNVYYAVMPDMSAGSGCDLGCGAGTPFENATSIASHELAEVITDPEVSLAAGFTAPLAWYDTFNGETGDICNGIVQQLTLGDGAPYAVQQFWSNADGACTAGGGTFTRAAIAAASAPEHPAAAALVQPAAAELVQPAPEADAAGSAAAGKGLQAAARGEPATALPPEPGAAPDAASAPR